MKVTQQYFVTVRAFLAALLVAFAAVTGAQANAHSRIRPSHSTPDPILIGPAPGPCASEVFSPSYVAGMDSYGYPVAPADLPGNVTVAIPSDVVFPEVSTHNRSIGRVDVPVVIPGLARAAAPPPVCAPHFHRHEKG